MEQLNSLGQSLDYFIISLLKNSSYSEYDKQALAKTLDVLYDAIVCDLASYSNDKDPTLQELIKKKLGLADYIIWFDNRLNTPRRKQIDEIISAMYFDDVSQDNGIVEDAAEPQYFNIADMITVTVSENLARRFIEAYSYLQHNLLQPARRELKLINNTLSNWPKDMGNEYFKWKAAYSKLDAKISGYNSNL